MVEHRLCGVCGISLGASEATKWVVDGHKDSARKFPRYRFSVWFHPNHTAQEKMKAMKAAEEICEKQAMETGAYTRRRF